jgi:hypothetical protein
MIKKKSIKQKTYKKMTWVNPINKKNSKLIWINLSNPRSRLKDKIKKIYLIKKRVNPHVWLRLLEQEKQI